MKKIYALLTKIGDKYGLLRDTKKEYKHLTDGLMHIKPHLVIQTAIVLVIGLIYQNMLSVVIASWWSWFGLTTYWILAELYQEYKMCQKNNKRKFSFNQHRVQDVALPSVTGLLKAILITVIWMMLK